LPAPPLPRNHTGWAAKLSIVINKYENNNKNNIADLWHIFYLFEHSWYVPAHIANHAISSSSFLLLCP